MSDVLRLLALDGPVVGVAVLVALAWLIVRLESTRTENATAHAAITTNIDVVKEQLTKEIDGVKRDVHDVKQDVRMLTAHLLRKTDASDLASRCHHVPSLPGKCNRSSVARR